MGKYKIEPRGLSRDSVNQLNKVFDQIETDIGKKPASATPTPRQQMIAANAPTPSGAVNLGGSATSNVIDINKGGSSPGPVGPPGPAGGAVATDGTTIGGDGDGTPLFLESPVALENGGTGISQIASQQITTNGTLIAAGAAQQQTSLKIPGVTSLSAAMWSLPNTPDATWQTGIFVILVCHPDTVDVWLINPTATGITPIAQTLNVKVIV